MAEGIYESPFTKAAKEKFNEIIVDECPYQSTCIDKVIVTTFPGDNEQSLRLAYGFQFKTECHCDQDNPEFLLGVFESAVLSVMSENGRKVDTVRRPIED